MTGATRRDYLNAITGASPHDWGRDLWRPSGRMARASEWVRKTYDKHARDRFRAYCEALPFNPEDLLPDAVQDDISPSYQEFCEALGWRYDQEFQAEKSDRAGSPGGYDF
jgi:hypothetical protein